MPTSTVPPPPLSLSRHTLRQLKFVLPGAVVVWYLDVYDVLWRTVGEGGLGRTLAISSLGLGLIIVMLFLYVLLIPWIRGFEPNYRSWRVSAELSSVIPVLTASIVLGWSLLSVTLGKFAGLGYLEGVIGASGLYALSFGLMGLIPAPKVRRV